MSYKILNVSPHCSEWRLYTQYVQEICLHAKGKMSVKLNRSDVPLYPGLFTVVVLCIFIIWLIKCQTFLCFVLFL